MGKAFALIYVSTVTMALCCEAVSAKAVPQLHRHRHERSHRRYQHLQDLIDRLDLRQRTDHILITNLQKALRVVQERGADFKGEKDVKLELKNEGATLHFEEEKEERQKEANSQMNDQERRDEILLLREEITALRSEVRALKAERAVESQHRAAHSLQQERRETLTASWVVENVKRLQDAVVELQEAINVTTALHDKQEVESRLLVVGRDLSALRSSLSSVTSTAEAAMATAETVREELVRAAKSSNHASGKVDELGLQVSWMREEFNSLLSALPDGIKMRDLNTTAKESIKSSDEAAADEESAQRENGPSTLLQKVKNAMQPLRDDLNSSVTALEHIRTAPPAPSPAKEVVQLEERVKTTESELWEVRASSVQLLEALEALETQVERGVAEVRQEVAKLEYKVTGLQDCANYSEVPSNRAAIKALVNRMDQVDNRLNAIQDSGKMTKVPSFHSNSDSMYLHA